MSERILILLISSLCCCFYYIKSYIKSHPHKNHKYIPLRRRLVKNGEGVGALQWSTLKVASPSFMVIPTFRACPWPFYKTVVRKSPPISRRALGYQVLSFKLESRSPGPNDKDNQVVRFHYYTHIPMFLCRK